MASKRKVNKPSNVITMDGSLLESEIRNFEIFKADELEPKVQPWLWPGLIPLNTTSLFAGEGGIGKSHLLIEIAAKISTGEKFNAGGFDHELPKGKVLMMTAEDDLEYTVKPKLIAANADCSQILITRVSTGALSKTKKFIDLRNDLLRLKALVSLEENKDIKLIIIDPVLYFIGDLNENFNAEVSNFLGELSDFAKEIGVSIVLNKHFRKKSSGTNITSAMDEVGGAGSWVNSPRVSWAITRWHEDPNIIVISNIKGNILKRSEDCFAYKIESCSIEIRNGVKIASSRLIWLDKMIKISSNDAVNKENFEKSKHTHAYEFIINYLTDNGQSVFKTLKDAALSAGIKLRTFESAASKIKDERIVNITIGATNNKLWMLREFDGSK